MTAALLQAGGQSSRMRHGGGPEHKALVTVHGRTMLQWNLDALLSAGVTAIFLAVNKGETGLLRYGAMGLAALAKAGLPGHAYVRGLSAEDRSLLAQTNVEVLEEMASLPD